MSLTVNQFDEILTQALASLYEDLSHTLDPKGKRSWWRREQELVSLFTFKHLLPILQRVGIDPGVLRIEGRVPQVQTETHKNERARRDLVVWNHHLDTCWRPDCQQPLAVLEWKLSTSRRTSNRMHSAPANSVNADIQWLTRNCHLMGVGYSIFVEWPDGILRIRCVRVCSKQGLPAQWESVLLPQPAPDA
jgi:hypothetical protein